MFIRQKEQYIQQIENVLSVTSFVSSDNFLWFGKKTSHISPEVKKEMTEKTIKNHMHFFLQNHLYTNFYCKGTATAIDQEAYSSEPLRRINPFVLKLSAANRGIGYWEDNWKVKVLENDQVAAEKNGLTLKISKQQLELSQSIEKGSMISIRFPKELSNSNEAYYIALSNVVFNADDWQDVVRIYWNLTPKGAILLMDRITTFLNEMILPFRLKILKDLTQFTRCDAGVLYFRKKDYMLVFEWLDKIYPKIHQEIRTGLPVFTKYLSAGIGLAESPAGGASFGMHRCQLLAQGMMAALATKRLLPDQIKVVAETFREHGISLAKPYLNPNADDIYQHCFRPGKSTSFLYQTSSLSKKFGASAYLQVAVDIGHSICRQAIWHQDRCTWIGYGLEDPLHATSCMTLGPDLYQGTSGIASFLAELYKMTGDKKFLKTSLGALRQSLKKLLEIYPAKLMGYYYGGLGIACTAAQIGNITGNNAWLEKAKEIVRYCLQNQVSGENCDMVSGYAGSIIALLFLEKNLKEPGLLDIAKVWGEKLLTAAIPLKEGCAWKTINAPQEHCLTGFSHGAAGIGYTLAELYAAIGDKRYQTMTEQAFRYEHYWFDAAKKNWPDLREQRTTAKPGRYPLPFCTYWCYGAPGIALSRLRAYAIFHHDTYQQEAQLALQTTYQWVTAMLHTRTMNFSLCHGLGGNADILHIGSQQWVDFKEGREMAIRVAEAGMALQASENGWSCGTKSGATPGLMLGLAGIGYFYLRMFDPDIASPLMPGYIKKALPAVS